MMWDWYGTLNPTYKSQDGKWIQIIPLREITAPIYEQVLARYSVV